MSESPPKSTFNYPNKFARIYLEAIESVIGRQDLNKLLEEAGIPELIHYPPPDNMNKQFDFAYFTGLQQGFEKLYGAEKGKEIAYETGRASFTDGLRNFGDLAGVTSAAFQVLPLETKLRLSLPAMAAVIMQFSDQVSRAYKLNEESYVFTMERCPMCWGWESEDVHCYAGLGLIKKGLNWLSNGKEFRVEMAACIAKGDEMGRYVIYKDPLP